MVEGQSCDCLGDDPAKHSVGILQHIGRGDAQRPNARASESRVTALVALRAVATRMRLAVNLYGKPSIAAEEIQHIVTAGVLAAEFQSTRPLPKRMPKDHSGRLILRRSRRALTVVPLRAFGAMSLNIRSTPPPCFAWCPSPRQARGGFHDRLAPHRQSRRDRVTGAKLYDPPRNGEVDRSAEPSGGGGPRRLIPPILRTPIKRLKRARGLRRQMSLPEVLLWKELRKRPAGLKFRKQFPIDEMTVDFACLERRLVIEIDGEGHSFGDQPRRDAARDASLRRDGFRVLRIAARDVLKNIDGVLQFILATCSEVGPLHHDAARRGPPLRSGEEFR